MNINERGKYLLSARKFSTRFRLNQPSKYTDPNGTIRNVPGETERKLEHLARLVSAYLGVDKERGAVQDLKIHYDPKMKTLESTFTRVGSPAKWETVVLDLEKDL